jgi:hypothetical protein
MLVCIRGNAKRRGLDFNLDVSDIVIPERCPVLGMVLARNTTGIRKPHACSPSVDRIDPSQGYVKGNVAIISYRANRIKNDANSAELRLIADWLDRQNVT